MQLVASKKVLFGVPKNIPIYYFSVIYIQ